MRYVPAREIKRRGISAVDEQLKEGPVYIIKNDEPNYVVLSREQYEDLIDFENDEPILERIRQSVAEIESGQVEYKTAEELIKEFELEE
jgi:PHD/YefM family antitoxin component YafN of YafNO toxin-antitoxin module